MTPQQKFQFNGSEKATITLRTDLEMSAICEIVFSTGIRITGIQVSDIPTKICLDGYRGDVIVNILSSYDDINPIAFLN